MSNSPWINESQTTARYRLQVVWMSAGQDRLYRKQDQWLRHHGDHLQATNYWSWCDFLWWIVRFTRRSLWRHRPRSVCVLRWLQLRRWRWHICLSRAADGSRCARTSTAHSVAYTNNRQVSQFARCRHLQLALHSCVASCSSSIVPAVWSWPGHVVSVSASQAQTLHSSYRSRSALLRRSTGHVFRKISASMRYSPVRQTPQTGSLRSLMPSVPTHLINIARCSCANDSCQLEAITDSCRRRRWMLKDSVVNWNDAGALLTDQKTMLRTGRCVDVRTESS